MKKLFKISLCCLFTFSGLVLFAQHVSHYNDNWMFADQHSFNFTSGTPTYVPGTVLSDPDIEGVSAISDGSGNILFYSDAQSVYDANNNPMPNGNGTINGFISARNACLISKVPGDCDKYYLFSIQDSLFGAYRLELRYSVIDMSLNGGLGDVDPTQNNVLIYTESHLTEKMISVQKGLSEDYWIVVRKNLSDEFLSFEVTSAGINTTPVVSVVSSNTYSYTPVPAIVPSFGWLAVSPFNDAIIETSGFTNSCLYDFDNLTGILSNQEVLINNPYTPPAVMTFLLGDGCAFSPDGQIIYMSVFDGTANSGFLYRYDRSGGPGSVAATLQTSAISDLYSTMHARNDGKIYFAVINQPGLSVINDPNNFSAPDILLNQYMYPSGVADLSLANDFKLWGEQLLPSGIAGNDTTMCTNGPVDLGCSSCDSIGASYFWEPAAMVLNPNNKTTQSVSLSASQTFTVHVLYCGDTISIDTIEVTIEAATTPLLDTIGSICTNENAVLSASALNGGVINWYSDATLSNNVGSGTTLNLGNVTTPGEHIYYATETGGTCVSDSAVYTFWTSDCPEHPCALNLLPNGDFENYLSCPDDGYSIYQDSAVTVTDWENGIIDVAQESDLTPDYYNQNCAFFGSGTYSAPYDSPNGDGYAGFISTAPFGAPEKEMLGMMYDFNPCQEYTLQLKIIQGKTSVLSAPLSTDIVIYGGNSGGLPLLSPSICPLDQGFEIMATIPFESIDSIWRTFDLVFTPSDNYDCFIIGADCTNPSIGLDAVFVDDVFLCVDTLNSIDPDLGEGEFVCANDSIELNPEMPGYDHLWNTGETTESIFVSEAGSYYVTVTDLATGCSASDTVVVTEVPVAEETDIQTACDTYTWMDGITYTESNNTATYTITSVVGCDSVIYTLNLIINGPSCFSIPGGFSPNGDQVNDTWQVNGLDAFVNVNISIYDRWGQKLFYSSNPMVAWDGTCNGRECPTADYYYIIELGNGETYNGVVVLKR